MNHEQRILCHQLVDGNKVDSKDHISRRTDFDKLNNTDQNRE